MQMGGRQELHVQKQQYLLTKDSIHKPVFKLSKANQSLEKCKPHPQQQAQYQQPPCLAQYIQQQHQLQSQHQQ